MSKLEGDIYPFLHAMLLCCSSTVCPCHRGNAGFYTFANVNSSSCSCVEWFGGWMWDFFLVCFTVH